LEGLEEAKGLPENLSGITACWFNAEVGQREQQDLFKGHPSGREMKLSVSGDMQVRVRPVGSLLPVPGV
jgi:hypothetical protein